jgi:hypothetical protein
MVTALRKKDRKSAILATAILNEFLLSSCEFRYSAMVKPFVDMECDLLAGHPRNYWAAFPMAFKFWDRSCPDSPFARALEQQVTQ